MFNDLHISMAKAAGRPVTEHIALSCMIKNGVCPTIELKCTVRTSGERLITRGRGEIQKGLSRKYVLV
jgi:hypothetical protein